MDIPYISENTLWLHLPNTQAPMPNINSKIRKTLQPPHSVFEEYPGMSTASSSSCAGHLLVGDNRNPRVLNTPKNDKTPENT